MGRFECFRQSAYPFAWCLYYRALGHTFDIHNVDIAITHGPPKGVMDTTRAGDQAGCPDLFEAIARARPQMMYYFGHIHEAWGAKLVTWRQQLSEKPSHLTDIDGANSVLIAELPPLKREADKEPVRWSATSHCSGDRNPPEVGAKVFLSVWESGTPHGIRYNRRGSLILSFPRHN